MNFVGSRITLSMYICVITALLMTSAKSEDIVCKTANETHLGCNGVGLTSLPSKSMPRTLLYLDLSNNDIVDLPDNFYYLPELLYLDLSNNSIVDLSHGFQLPKLLHLDLSNNHIEGLFDGFNLPELLDLDLSNNGIGSLSDVFKLPKLTYLNLSHNAINASKSAFKSLNKLRVLDLSYNRITGEIFDKTFLDGCDEVRMLNISHNPLKILSKDAFLEYNVLNEIDISYCELTIIHYFVMLGATRLTRLHMRGNLITDETAVDAFSSISQVRYLDVGENEIRFLTGEYFKDHESLKELLLDGNKISGVQSFGEMKYLASLNLDNNKFASFPLQLYEFANLTSLQFSGNPMESINTSRSRINIIHLTMDNLANLKTLGEYSLSGLKTLQSLKIRHSSLSSIHKDAFKGTNIKTLSLTDNKLTSIPRDLVDWNKMDHVSLEGNPWYCDCSIEWLRNVSKHWNMNLICDGPDELKGQKLELIPYHTLPCMAMKTKAVIVGVTLIAVLFLLTILTFIIRRRVKKTKGWRHCWRRVLTSCRCCSADAYAGNGYTSVHVYSNNIDEPTVSIITHEHAQDVGSDDEEEPKVTDELDVHEYMSDDSV